MPVRVNTLHEMKDTFTLSPGIPLNVIIKSIIPVNIDVKKYMCI